MNRWIIYYQSMFDGDTKSIGVYAGTKEDALAELFKRCHSRHLISYRAVTAVGAHDASGRTSAQRGQGMTMQEYRKDPSRQLSPAVNVHYDTGDTFRVMVDDRCYG